MNVTQILEPTNELQPLESQDEFASGSPNRLRHAVSRLVGWIFNSPNFPTELIWFLSALIASDGAVELLPQPVTFWIDPSTSPYHSFLGAPFKWGLWIVGICIIYMILVGLTLSLLNVKLSFPLWMGLCIYHFWSLTFSFSCRAVNYFSFQNPNNCSGYHTAALLLAGILWGIAILFAARLGLIPWIVPQEEMNGSAHKLRKGSRIFSISWIGLMGLAVMLAARVPKPDWSLVEPVHSPSGRSSASLAYDTHRSVATLFGGITSWSQSKGWGSTNDTWEWDGNDWIELHPVHIPSPRYGAGMVFDEKRRVNVLFGGSGQDVNYQTIFNNDTWEWNGEDWLEVIPSSKPPARQCPNMFFDPLREAVVIYGGYYVDTGTQENIFLDDAWEWDGKTWKQIAFDEPRRNSASAIIYDPLRQLPLLMDGEGFWYWEGALWAQPGYATPPGRWGSQMAYDPTKQVLVLAGGSKGENILNDSWVYGGQDWQQLITKTQFPARDGHNLFYDQTRGKVLLFGGRKGLDFYNDMWELMQP